MIAPPSLGTLPVASARDNARGAGGIEPGTTGPGADPFDDAFLISVLRDELGAEVVDLPLKPAEVPADTEPAGLMPLFRVDCFPGPVAEALPGRPTGAAPDGDAPAADERDGDVIVIAAPAPQPIDLPLVKLATPGACYAPGTDIDDVPRQDEPAASAPRQRPEVPAAEDDRTIFAGGEGVKLTAKAVTPEPSIWTAPPIARLEVPSTTWRADAPKSREMQELLTSKIGEGGAHVVVTHSGALTASAPSATIVTPLANTAFHTSTSSVTTTARSESSVPGENADRIVQSIRLQWTRGGGEARITLEPSHLGELTVTLKVDQGVVAVRLQAETPVVREWLQTQAQTLRQALAEHQLTLDKLEIAAPSGADQSRDRDEQPARDFRGSRDSRESRRGRRSGADATFDLEA